MRSDKKDICICVSTSVSNTVFDHQFVGSIRVILVNDTVVAVTVISSAFSAHDKSAFPIDAVIGLIQHKPIRSFAFVAGSSVEIVFPADLSDCETVLDAGRQRADCRKFSAAIARSSADQESPGARPIQRKGRRDRRSFQTPATSVFPRSDIQAVEFSATFRESN